MRKLIPLFAVACLMFAGCDSWKKDDDMNRDNNMNMRQDNMNKDMKKDMSSSSSEPKKMMSQDACPQCPGVQTATADGKCPVCGMKVK